MRLTSEFWVAALVRRAQGIGAFATVLNKGAASAGSIYVIVTDMLGQYQLLGPAPQAFYDSDDDGVRKFELVAAVATADEVRERIERELSFDPDIWVVEIEDREMRSFIEDVVQH